MDANKFRNATSIKEGKVPLLEFRILSHNGIQEYEKTLYTPTIQALFCENEENVTHTNHKHYNKAH